MVLIWWVKHWAILLLSSERFVYIFAVGFLNLEEVAIILLFVVKFREGAT